MGAGTVAILRIGITGDRPTAISSPRSLAIGYNRPAQAVDRHAVRLVKQARYCGASARIKFDDEHLSKTIDAGQ
jgi:hypothetical protein